LGGTDLTRAKLTDSLKTLDDINVSAPRQVPGDGAAIDNMLGIFGRAGDQSRCRYVLSSASNRRMTTNKTLQRSRHEFDGVGETSRLGSETALSAHRDTVTNGDGANIRGTRRPRHTHASFDLSAAGYQGQMVRRSRLCAGHADEWFVKIVVGQANSTQH